MTDLKDYDNAVHKFSKSLKFYTLPVLSWDFYAHTMDDLKEIAEDVQSLMKIAATNSWAIDTQTIDTHRRTDKKVIIVTDAKLNIVFASKNIVEMNQYHPNEIVGKKPKMFQGAETELASLKVIREAITKQQPFETKLLNYRKDGTIYRCWIQGQPVFNKEGKVVNFIAFEKEVA